MRTTFFLLGLAALLVCTLVAGAEAQEPKQGGAGIAVGPLNLLVDVSPGEVWEGSIRMYGRVPDAVSVFDVEIMDLGQAPNGKKMSVGRGQGVRSAADWIDVLSEVRLTGGEQREIPVTVSVPADAYGIYSAYIAVRLRPDERRTQLAAVVVPVIDIEVFVSVRGGGPLELRTDRVEVNSAADGSQTVTADVINTGVWMCEVAGDLLFYSESGGFPERAEFPLRSDGRRFQVYPGQRVALSCTPSRRIPPGGYTVRARLDLGERRESRSEFALTIAEIGGGARSAADAREKTEVGTDIWIERPVHEISLPPGAVRSVPIRVSNLGEESITLDVVVEDARLESDGRWTYADSPTAVAGLTVDVAPDTLVVGPNVSQSVRATARMDRDAELHESVTKGVRFVGRQDGGDGESTTVYDAGALIIIEPKGVGSASLRVESLDLVRSHPESNPGSAVLTVANEGDGVGEVRGRVSLHTEAGELVAEMAIGSRNWERVMPGGQRKFRMALPLVADGVFTVSVDLEQKGGEGDPLTADASFTSTEAVPEGLR